MRSDEERIGDILQAIAKIREHPADNFDAFQRDEMLQVWVIHHLRIIGEAARSLSQCFQDRFSEVPWPQIIALRNILVHEYFGINIQQVWTMVQKDLIILDEQIEHIRRDLASDKL